MPESRPQRTARLEDRPLPTRFLLTNDDGIDAPGLKSLAQAIAAMGDSWIFAPVGEYSNGGHAVTTGRPIAFEPRSEDRIAVTGSPADCVRLALHELRPGPDWVISGINAGGNLGADIHYSGTVAAAREAALHGLSAIAVSHYIARGRPVDWDRAAERVSIVLKELLRNPCAPGTFWNVNLPHPLPDTDRPELVICPLDPSPLPLSYEIDNGRSARYAGNYHGRLRVPGSDVDVCLGGRITATLLRLA